MPRFLIDEDLPHLLAKLQTEKGHHSEHVRDLNLRGSPDSRVREVAQQRQTVPVTGDADFGDLLRYPLATRAPKRTVILMMEAARVVPTGD